MFPLSLKIEVHNILFVYVQDESDIILMWRK